MNKLLLKRWDMITKIYSSLKILIVKMKFLHIKFFSCTYGASKQSVLLIFFRTLELNNFAFHHYIYCKYIFFYFNLCLDFM